MNNPLDGLHFLQRRLFSEIILAKTAVIVYHEYMSIIERIL